ncbi:cytochrome c3 family protein [Ferrimonas senticii]|uniref:cytochrome c3 family protein n=1 Tax=Ferrimonas senticii TaxID=394566 RepID=UPI0005511A5A
MKQLCICASLALGLACGVHAQDQRDYHQPLYEEGCDSCHDQGMNKFPSDEACLQCHDPAEVAEQTAREGEEKLQNPHDSMHYGQDAPCMECHGEHTPKKALCQECHNFDYPKFK